MSRCSIASRLSSRPKATTGAPVFLGCLRGLLYLRNFRGRYMLVVRNGVHESSDVRQVAGRPKHTVWASYYCFEGRSTFCASSNVINQEFEINGHLVQCQSTACWIVNTVQQLWRRLVISSCHAFRQRQVWEAHQAHIVDRKQQRAGLFLSLLQFRKNNEVPSLRKTPNKVICSDSRIRQ